MPRRKSRKKGKDVKNTVYIAMLIVTLAVAASAFFYRYSALNSEPETITIPVNVPQSARYHVHADFKVFINGEETDFTNPEYDAVNPLIHLHTDNYKGGYVMHVESRDVTMGDFFSSLGMDFSRNCFSSEEKDYCNNRTHALRFYVNGTRNSEYGNYRPHDLDRILITYGNQNEKEIKQQIDSVTSLACVFSGGCPFPMEAEGRIFYN